MKRLIAIASVAFTLCACGGFGHGSDFKFDDNPDKTRRLTLPDGRGCTGKLKFTGGGYAAVHYNFLCNDGRIFFNIENAEVR